MQEYPTDDRYQVAVQEPSILATKDLTVTYGEHPSLDETSLTFPKNKVTALIGPSGSGKSTFLRSLNRMNDEVATVGGQVIYQGQDVNTKQADVYQLRQRMGMVFQHPNPFARSIWDNLTLVPRQFGVRGHAQLAELVETQLRRVTLWDEVKDRLHESALGLSGGQQQRLCIARALALDPDVLLLDEPASALDPLSTAKLEETINELKIGRTTIVVTHNLEQAARISDYCAFFYLGHMLEYNRTAEMFEKPALQATDDYLAGHFG